jgi:hypothetical protein|tara:strand:+ start:473 stop:655 length:183 start_codon:yes stop_codon:yes gene_type:complete
MSNIPTIKEQLYQSRISSAAQILAKHRGDNYEIAPILTLIMEKSCIYFVKFSELVALTEK